MQAPYPWRYWRLLGLDFMVHRIAEFSLGAMFLLDADWNHWHLDVCVGPYEICIGRNL